MTNQLFEQIKADNLAEFEKTVANGRGILNTIYGRFPVLSLLYLYRATRIIEKYEERLLIISTYSEAEEPYDAYKKFASLSKRALRLFSDICTPVEMLAVLGERAEINRIFNPKKDDATRIAKIFDLIFEVTVPCQNNAPAFQKLPLPRFQKLVISISIFIILLVVILSATAGTVIASLGGRGIATDPFIIRTAEQFSQAMLRGTGYFILENDLVISAEFSIENFAGTLDGMGNTITSLERTSALIGTLATGGTLRNIDFEFGDVSFDFDRVEHGQDIADSPLIKTNRGTIDNTSAFANLTINAIGTNPTENTNSPFVGVGILVGENFGVINNSRATSESVHIESTPTVHIGVGGIVGNMMVGATLTNNFADIGWAPSEGRAVAAVVGRYVTTGRYQTGNPLFGQGNMIIAFEVDDLNAERVTGNTFISTDESVLGIGFLQFRNHQAFSFFGQQWQLRAGLIEEWPYSLFVSNNIFNQQGITGVTSE